MKNTATLDDYKDMRAQRCYFTFGVPVIEDDYTLSMVFDSYYFGGKSKPEMKFINEFTLSNESGFLASALTVNGLKAALSNNSDDIVNALCDMVARSLLLYVLIESHERIHGIYEAPIPIGVTHTKELTRKYEVIFQKKKCNRNWRKNSEIETYALESAFPVSESIMPEKSFFRVGGNNVCQPPKAIGLEFQDTEDGSALQIESLFPEASDTDGNGGFSRAAEDKIHRALELCGYLDDGRKDCFTRFPKTVIGTYPNPAFGMEDHATTDRSGKFNKADGWTGYAYLLHKAMVTEFIPGNDGRIFMIFEANQFIQDIDFSCAYDDEQYLIKRIDGCLKAVGPVDRVKEESRWFTVVFAPVESGEYAFSGAFPGRPDLNPLVEGLEEGDIIYGSEVNARRLQPVVSGS